MKPQYLSLTLTATTLRTTVSIYAQSTDGTVDTTIPIPANLLDSLRVELIAPNVSGARDLIASGECTVSGNKLIGKLQTGDWLKGSVYRVQLSAIFGTQTEVFYAINITVPRYTELTDDTQDIQTHALVVLTVGGAGGGGGADATVYSKDSDGHAHITTPLNVSGGVQEGNPYGSNIYELNVVVLTEEQKAEVEAATGTAYDYCDTNDDIPNGINVTIYSDEECTQYVGRMIKTQYEESPLVGDYFNLQEGESITEGTYYARIERRTLGFNSHAEGSGTVASGANSHAEGTDAVASGDYSHTEGRGTSASGEISHAEGFGASASGSHSHAEGDNTTASGSNSHAEGSSTIASNSNSHAEGVLTTASGGNSHAEGSSTIASGENSHAEGLGTIASQQNQHVCGQYNIEDTNDSYQFIVGNGVNDITRRNAFAVTKAGELVLFRGGTIPVIMDAAKLAELIATLS